MAKIKISAESIGDMALHDASNYLSIARESGRKITEQPREISKEFTEDELRDMSVAAVRLRGEVEELKAAVKVKDSRVKELERSVQMEKRMVDITVAMVWHYPEVNRVTEYDIETEELVGEREMSPWEQDEHSPELF